MLINDKLLNVLQKAIEVRGEAHSVIASNIANSETPGYKSKSLDFDQTLAGALSVSDSNPTSAVTKTDEQHLGGSVFSNGHLSVIDEKSNGTRLDGNTVVLEEELVRLGRNESGMRATISITQKQLAWLRMAINDGRGG